MATLSMTGTSTAKKRAHGVDALTYLQCRLWSGGLEIATAFDLGGTMATNVHMRLELDRLAELATTRQAPKLGAGTEGWN
jgi:hypothetical protein